jgi:hypothetical protein
MQKAGLWLENGVALPAELTNEINKRMSCVGRVQ